MPVDDKMKSPPRDEAVATPAKDEDEYQGLGDAIKKMMPRAGWLSFGAFALFIVSTLIPIGTIFLILTLTGIMPDGTTKCFGTLDSRSCYTEPGPIPATMLWSIIISVGCLGFFGMCALSHKAIVSARGTDYPGLSELVGPSPNPSLSSPAAIEEVWAALDRLNELDLPYSLSSDTRAGKTIVTVRWRREDVKWRRILGLGKATRAWVMMVSLFDNGRYGFVEKVSAKAYAASPASASYERSLWFGKSLGLMSLTSVYAPGMTDTKGKPIKLTRSTVSIGPSDAKVPIFRILRAYGWRPRFDNWVSELFEY